MATDLGCTTSNYLSCTSIGISVLYMMFLAFALFQTRDDFRNILFFFDPLLKLEGPDTKVRIARESIQNR